MGELRSGGVVLRSGQLRSGRFTKWGGCLTKWAITKWANYEVGKNYEVGDFYEAVLHRFFHFNSQERLCLKIGSWGSFGDLNNEDKFKLSIHPF